MPPEVRREYVTVLIIIAYFIIGEIPHIERTAASHGLSDRWVKSTGMKTLPTKEERNWSKIGIIVVGVAFAVLFIGTYILTILTGTVFAPLIKDGDTVILDITIRDSKNRPILTTSQDIYNEGRGLGYPVFFAQRFQVMANRTYNETLIGVDAFNPRVSSQWVTYGIFGPEMDMISAGVVGTKVGEKKTIDLTSLFGATRTMTIDEFESLVGNFSRAQPGDMIPLAFSEQPVIPVDGAEPVLSYKWRTMEVVDKTSENVTISYWYATADVTIVEKSRQ